MELIRKYMSIGVAIILGGLSLYAFVLLSFIAISGMFGIIFLLVPIGFAIYICFKSLKKDFINKKTNALSN